MVAYNISNFSGSFTKLEGPALQIRKGNQSVLSAKMFPGKSRVSSLVEPTLAIIL